MKPIKILIEGIEAAKAERVQLPIWLNTGFKSLDQQVEGYRKGDIVVVGGRPGMGKSAFLLSTALRLGKVKKTDIIIFSN